MQSEVAKIFGNRIRVRVCGLIIENEKVLLLNHKGMNKSGIFWALPGGGVEQFESIENALIREIKEEINVDVKSIAYLKTTEFIKSPLHAIEIFFRVELEAKNKINLGFDPELADNQQLIYAYKWFSFEEVQELGINHAQKFLIELKKDYFRN